ncbi:hypothetical protein ACFO3O_18635 [Dokdonia ponticola]|uniref:Uncharacterized protein n=1 Tax=Dokdonia ponticola TaxID=2041041 RepID=A0ABV9I2L1_9FLAO
MSQMFLFLTEIQSIEYHVFINQESAFINGDLSFLFVNYWCVDDYLSLLFAFANLPARREEYIPSDKKINFLELYYV